VEQFSRRQGFRLMLGATQAVLLGAAGCPLTGYAATVTGIPGLLAYWRFSNAQQLIDQTGGGRHGTFDGPVSLVAGLPTDSDAATHLPGTLVGTVPHDGGLALAAFSISGWFNIRALPASGAAGILSKDLNGIALGDLTLRVWADGSLELLCQDATESHIIEAGSIAIGVDYHFAITADASGIELWLNGSFIGKEAAFTDGWASNTQQLLFGRAQWSANILNYYLDEVALFSRVLTDGEIVALSQVSVAPTAIETSASVEEGSAIVLAIVDNCTFVGRKSDLIVEVWDGNSWETSASTINGTVSVNASNDLVFTADASTGPGTDSFLYRITDPNGVSNSAEIDVTIADSGGGEPEPLGLCFILSSSSVQVNSSGALGDAVTAANGGGPRNILIQPGTYSGWNQTLNFAGSEGDPITISPRDGLGSVTLTNSAWTLAGARGVVERLHWNNAELKFAEGSHHCRISRNRFRQIGRRTITLKGFDHRINHNDFAEYQANDDPKSCITAFASHINAGVVGRILMDYNYLHDINKSNDVKDQVPMYLSTGAAWNKFPGFIVDHCLLQNMDIAGLGEYIVVKHSGMIIRFCTFDNLDAGYLQQRLGSGWEVRSNWFQSMTGAPLKSWDDNAVPGVFPLVIGNRLVSGDLWVGAGTRTDENATNAYHASIGGKYIGNVMSNGSIRVGEMWSNQPNNIAAQNNTLYQNTASGGEVIINATGTTHNVDNQPYVAAVKLTSSDVGPLASDPLCP
jgi:Concanavalin A-like lectin/glucanases superfamily/Bacterial Ig domain